MLFFQDNVGNQADRTEYPDEALVDNFSSLLNDVHYQEVLEIFDIGFMQLNRRKLIKWEFQALYVALWRLALIRSFPDRYERIFQTFMDKQAAASSDRRELNKRTERCLQYVDKLREQGDTDFSEVSRHLLSLMEFDETRTKAMILKLALHLRKMYVYFFDNLM